MADIVKKGKDLFLLCQDIEMPDIVQFRYTKDQFTVWVQFTFQPTSTSTSFKSYNGTLGRA